MSNPSGNTMTATRPCCVRQDACLGQVGMSVLVNVYNLINGKREAAVLCRTDARICDAATLREWIYMYVYSYNTCTKYVHMYNTYIAKSVS